MALQGELKNMPLSDILQSLKGNQQSGTLHLQDGIKKFALFFDKGSIISVCPGRPSSDYFIPIVCQYLSITPATMEREVGKKLKSGIASKLDKANLANESKINSLHGVYLTEFLYEAFAWHSGSFRFEEGPLSDQVFDEDQREAGLHLEIDQVVFESMRRFDEWKEISRSIPTMYDVFTVTDEYKLQVEQLTDPDKSTIALCNGEHNVKELAYRLGQDLFTTASILNHALDQQMVRRIAPNDLIVLAEHCFSHDRCDDALRYFKRAIELDRGNIEVRMHFANLCAKEGIISEATNEFKTLAQLAREKQEYENAKLFYRKIIELNPSEYEFQKRLYEMLRDINDGEAPTIGLALADTLKRLGLRREEALVLNQLIEDNAEDACCYERLGDAERSLGHNKTAIEKYLTAVEICIRSDDPLKACSNCENILSINPDDTKTKKRLEELQSGMYLEKRRRRRKIIIAAEIGAFVIVACSYLTYNAFSTMDYITIRNQNILSLAQDDFGTIENAMMRFKKSHPFALVNLDLKRYQAKIKGVIAIHQADSRQATSSAAAVKEPVTDTLHADDTSGNTPHSSVNGASKDTTFEQKE